MADKPKRPRDANQLAAHIVGVATGEIDDTVPEKAEGQRKGGLRGGKARARKLTPKERSAIAKKGAGARWQKGRIDQNMPLLALDQLAGIEAVAVDASPPFSALFTL